MRISVQLTADQRGRQALAGLPGLARRAAAATAEELQDFVGDEAGKHTRTGRLFASVISRRLSDREWFIGHDGQVAPHALFVHWGTKPHVIEPKNKKALRWPAGGQFAFAKRVNHPGYRGDPWLVRASAQAPTIFARQVDRLLAGAAAPMEA